MLDLLSDFLDANTTPEEKIKVEHAHAIFERIELENYELAFENILNIESIVDAGETLCAILNITRQIQHYILKDISVIMSEDTDMEILTNIIAGILDLEAHEENAQIKTIAIMEAPPREVFCELLTMVTKYSVEDLLQIVEDISPSLLKRIIEHKDDNKNPEDQEDAVNRDARINAFKAYDLWLPEGAPPRVTEIIKSGVDVDLPYLIYLNIVGPMDFEQMNPLQISQEMFGMALISSDGHSSPQEIIKENLETFISNNDTITDVMYNVNQLHREFLK